MIKMYLIVDSLVFQCQFPSCRCIDKQGWYYIRETFCGECGLLKFDMHMILKKNRLTKGDIYFEFIFIQ